MLAAAAEHERHMIGERTRRAVAAAKARGVKLNNPEQAKINREKAAARAQALRPHIERCIKAGRHRAVPSHPISTRAASRHRMAANGFRCRCYARAIVSAYDRPGGFKTWAWEIRPRAGGGLPDGVVSVWGRASLTRRWEVRFGGKPTLTTCSEACPYLRRSIRGKLAIELREQRVTPLASRSSAPAEVSAEFFGNRSKRVPSSLRRAEGEISTSLRTAAITPAEVLVRCPRRRVGRRISVWTPPTQWMSRTISDIGNHLMDHGADDALLQPCIVVGSVQTLLRSAVSVVNDAGSTVDGTVAASWAAILASTSATRESALFHRVSSSPVTNRLAGSAASYCRKARSAA